MMQYLLGLIFVAVVTTELTDICDYGECKPGHTCCPIIFEGLYMCCPFDGVCCPGQIHCCPKGYVCGPEKRTCISEKSPNEILSFNILKGMDPFQNKLIKRQGLPVEERPLFQNRCDDYSFCPYDSTCCLSLDGTYGCCPYMEATCCPDKVHCCPYNEKCDATSEYCIGAHTTFPSKAKEPPIAIDESSLV